MENKKLPVPKLTDLVNDSNKAFKDDQFKTFVNQTPPTQWVKKNPYAKDTPYLPIDKVELLLDTIFSNWKVEVLETKVLFNSISVNIRLHYKRPDTNEWTFHDGVGAKELQTRKESGVLKPDFSNVGKSAVEMALPIAKSAAIKDAADHIGKLFGRDLGRKDVTSFVGYHVNAINIDQETLKKGIKND